MIHRRRFLALGAIGIAGSIPANALGWQASGAALEEQRGDPDVPYEQLAFDSASVRTLVFGTQKASFAPHTPEFSTRLIATAATLVGRSRSTHRNDIAAFLALFRLPFEANGSPVPYCAAGLAFAAASAYADLLSMPVTEFDRLRKYRSILADLEHWYFYPSPSCWDMYHIAAGKRRWVAQGSEVVPKPGWVVIFDFGKGADHCGIVESADKTGIRTIEFNTSVVRNGDQRDGGVIAKKDRPYGLVKGYIRTDDPPPKNPE